MTLTKHIPFPIYYDAPGEPALIRWLRQMPAARRRAGRPIPRKKPAARPLVWQGGEALGARDGFSGGGRFR